MKENYLSKCTLLYVEDDENIRNMLKKRLEKKVKNIYIACDGVEGLAKFNELRPDIILTDVSMPKMNGIDMSRHIKEIDNNVPIVISSAHGDTKYLIESIELGINGYLFKPIDKIKLFEILEKNVKTVLIEQKLIEQKNKNNLDRKNKRRQSKNDTRRCD